MSQMNISLLPYQAEYVKERSINVTKLTRKAVDDHMKLCGVEVPKKETQGKK